MFDCFWLGRAELEQRRLPLKTDGRDGGICGGRGFFHLWMRMEDCDSESKHGTEVYEMLQVKESKPQNVFERFWMEPMNRHRKGILKEDVQLGTAQVVLLGSEGLPEGAVLSLKSGPKDSQIHSVFYHEKLLQVGWHEASSAGGNLMISDLCGMIGERVWPPSGFGSCNRIFFHLLKLHPLRDGSIRNWVDVFRCAKRYLAFGETSNL